MRCTLWLSTGFDLCVKNSNTGEQYLVHMFSHICIVVIVKLILSQCKIISILKICIDSI